MRYPGVIPEGMKVKALVQPHDIAATILGRAGLDTKEIAVAMPRSLDLIHLINKGKLDADQSVRIENITTRDQAVCVFRNTGYGRGGKYYNPALHATMFREKKYKLNLYHSVSNDLSEPEGELFDMENDPGETNNLWYDVEYINVKLSMINRLINWMVENDALYCGTRGGESVTEKADYKK